MKNIIVVLIFLLLAACQEKKQMPEQAEPIVVKVAVVIQDPMVPGTDQACHEYFKTPGYTFRWNDPMELTKAYADTLHAVSHGVVTYEIVEIIQDTCLFTRLEGKEDFLTCKELIACLGEEDWKTLREQNPKFDYKAFIEHYQFDQKRDRDEIHEVWLWGFPLMGTWESTYAGKGAFWLNSNPVEGMENEKLLTVMGLNYERNLACAMESYGHRVESVMRHVYGRWDCKLPKSEKNNWELYTTYDHLAKGEAHVGNIHFPPNGLKDYDFCSEKVVLSNADVWMNYPHIDQDRKREVNFDEWKNSHLGYMCWWHSHLPHFKGKNPKDGHLNNWWHYVVNYEEAMEKDVRHKM